MSGWNLFAVVAVSGLVAGCASMNGTTSEAPKMQTCGTPDFPLPALRLAADNAFASTPDEALTGIALSLATCLADPDPDIRDGLAYEGFVSLLRERKLPLEARLELAAELNTMMAAPDEAGFTAPFAVLVLAEVIRTGRVEQDFSDGVRINLVQSAADYMMSITDYRGYVDGEGWRHGIAHAADALMQAALDPANGYDAHLTILEAIKAQIAPVEHAYVFGEPQRLARPVLYVAAAGALSADDWTAWFADITDPFPLESWAEAYESEAGLRRLHNLKAFLYAIYPGAALTQNPDIAALRPLIETAIVQLP